MISPEERAGSPELTAEQVNAAVTAFLGGVRSFSEQLRAQWVTLYQDTRLSFQLPAGFILRVRHVGGKSVQAETVMHDGFSIDSTKSRFTDEEPLFINSITAFFDRRGNSTLNFKNDLGDDGNYYTQLMLGDVAYFSDYEVSVLQFPLDD